MEAENISRALAQRSLIPMAPVEQDQIQFLTLACGHTNMGMRSILWAVASTDPLLSDGEHYDLPTIEKRGPDMANGIRVTMD